MPHEIIPHLSFRGHCEKAINSYIAAFGGEVLYLSRWSADTFEATPEQIGCVMHAEFHIGGTRMAASDAFDAPETNMRIKLLVHMDTWDAAQYAAEILSEGGTVISPLRPHPAPDDGSCGSLTRDRFGYTWIITCPNPAKGRAYTGGMQ